MDVFRNILLWGSENAWLRDRVPNVGFVKKAVKRFMPGEEVEDALRAAGELKKSNINSVFTRLGENISDLSEAEQVAHHYVEVYKKIEESGLSTEISVKLTQLGLDLSFEEALKNFQTIAAKAQKQGNVLWIDIESSSYVDKTIEFYKRAKEKY